MRFDDLDKKMRVFETAHDHCVLPGIFIVARLDGRGFSKLTEIMDKPFDIKMRGAMVGTASALMDSGFDIVYGYTQSDEISLLFKRNTATFNRKLRKIESVLAGAASSAFTYSMNLRCAFDCRVSQLPTESLVHDYFRWRQEDANRNALLGLCYWTLRQSGHSKRLATATLEGKGAAAKRALLREYKVDFDATEAWTRLGTGLFYEAFPHEGVDPRTGTKHTVTRSRMVHEYGLPEKQEYSKFLLERIKEANNENAWAATHLR